MNDAKRYSISMLVFFEWLLHNFHSLEVRQNNLCRLNLFTVEEVVHQNRDRNFIVINRNQLRIPCRRKEKKIVVVWLKIKQVIRYAYLSWILMDTRAHLRLETHSWLKDI